MVRGLLKQAQEYPTLTLPFDELFFFAKNLVDNFELSLHTSNGSKKIDIHNSIVVDDPSEDSRAKIVALVAQKFINWCNTDIPEKPDFKDGLRVQELIDMTKTHS